MDIIPKSTHPKLNAFKEAEQTFIKSFEDLIDEKNLLASAIQDAQSRKSKLEEILRSLEKGKEELTFDNKTLTQGMEIAKQDITEKKREAELKIKREEEKFTLEKEAEQKRLAELLDTLEAKEDSLHAEDEKLNKLSKDLSIKEAFVNGVERELAKEKDAISIKSKETSENIKQVKVAQVDIEKREQAILPKEKQLKEEELDLKKKLDNFQEVFTNKTVQIEQLTKELEKREEQYKLKFKGLREIEGDLKKREIRLHDRETIFKMNSPR